jgi:hypothetical protein
MTKTVLCLTIGILLMIVGLSALPRFLVRVGNQEEEPGVLVGRAIVIFAELLIGAWLIFVGIRASKRSNRS